MSKPRNTDVTKPWNDPCYKDDPSKPWNDSCRKDDISACWNQIDGHGDYEEECNAY